MEEGTGGEGGSQGQVGVQAWKKYPVASARDSRDKQAYSGGLTIYAKLGAGYPSMYIYI